MSGIIEFETDPGTIAVEVDEAAMGMRLNRSGRVLGGVKEKSFERERCTDTVQA